jgi:hypothetical protein
MVQFSSLESAQKSAVKTNQLHVLAAEPFQPLTVNAAAVAFRYDTQRPFFSRRNFL